MKRERGKSGGFRERNRVDFKSANHDDRLAQMTLMTLSFCLYYLFIYFFAKALFYLFVRAKLALQC